MKFSGSRFFVSAVIVLVGATIIGGLFLAGSPTQERLRRADAQRLQNLQRIAASIDEFWRQQERLPLTLEELQSSRTAFLEPEALRDPDTQEPYGYRLFSTSTYALCAAFQTEAVEPDSRVPVPAYYGTSASGFWKHGKGPTCFSPPILDLPVNPSRPPKL